MSQASDPHNHQKSERRKTADALAIQYLTEHPAAALAELRGHLRKQGLPEALAAKAARYAWLRK